jgi:hypothetical protein
MGFTRVCVYIQYCVALIEFASRSLPWIFHIEKTNVTGRKSFFLCGFLYHTRVIPQSSLHPVCVCVYLCVQVEPSGVLSNALSCDPNTSDLPELAHSIFVLRRPLRAAAEGKCRCQLDMSDINLIGICISFC